jgi:hypothetical protein
MEYRTGDERGLPSRVLAIQTNGSDRADFFKYLHEPPADFDAKRATTGRARGPFVVKVQAPPGTKIAWLSAGGNFVTHQGEQAANTKNAITYSTDGRDFQPLYQATVPTDQSHWHYNADRELVLDKPASVVYLRYLGDPGVNNLRIYAHCVADRPRPRSSVTIKHAWKTGGEIKTFATTLDKPGSYEIDVAEGAVDDSIEQSIPSRKKGG